ncbi:MAG: hypothetical protein Q9157_008582, partial [Trypethelium eluteriae]
MASAVAVSADIERPNLPHNLDDDAPITGEVTSVDNDDDEEDVVRGARKKTTVDRDLFDEDDDELPAEENEEDLFGEDEADEQPRPPRQLDDEDLDSGDDLDRNDRMLEDEEEDEGEDVEKNFKYMNVDIGRHPLPEPSDGELYMLKIPQFMSLDPTIFKTETFQVPETDHHSTGPPSSTFS